MVSLAITPSNYWKISALEPNFSSTVAEGDIEYLIITPNAFRGPLEDLALWKTQKGVPAEVKTVEQIQTLYSEYDTAASIKACIEDYYSTKNTEFVLLAGDHQTVPTRLAFIDEDYPDDGNYVGCDSYYANMNDWDTDGDHIYAEDNDDWNLTADVYVGRLSGNSLSEMQSLVDRIIMYESNPPVGEWMNQAFFAGAMTYFNSDYNAPNLDDGILDYPAADGNRFFNFVSELYEDDMTITLLGEDGGIPEGQTPYFHNGSISATSLYDGITEGASILGVCGHGNAQGIYRLLWTSDSDGDDLYDWIGEMDAYYEPTSWQTLIHAASSGYTNPDNMLSVAYLMGCSNGNFTTPGVESLAEYMLRTVSIGSIGADRIVWGMDNWTELEYGGFYSEGLAYRFYEQLASHDQPGKAFALAKQDYCEDNATYGLPVFPGHPEWTQPKWSEKTVKHFNYFGDPELHVWMDIPDYLNATWTQYNSTSTLVEVIVEGSGPANGVSVTLTDNQDEVYWVGTTNSSGQVMVPYDYDTVNESVIVAYEPRYIPSIYEPYEYPSPNAPVLAEISPSIDRDGTIKLDWDDVTDALSYNVYRESSAISYTKDLTPIANTAESEYTDGDLVDGIYYYAITTVGDFGESDPSNCRFVTVEHRVIDGFSIVMISIAGFVALVIVASIVIPRIKARK
jgi:hypothetical protein